MESSIGLKRVNNMYMLLLLSVILCSLFCHVHVSIHSGIQIDLKWLYILIKSSNRPHVFFTDFEKNYKH